jgi:hypothetical protein
VSEQLSLPRAQEGGRFSLCYPFTDTTSPVSFLVRLCSSQREVWELGSLNFDANHFAPLPFVIADSQ